MVAAIPANIAKAANSDASDIAICGDVSTSPDKRISACTRLIKRGHLNDEELSNAYGNRGAGFGTMEKHDRALADFNESIRIDRDNGSSLYNRGALRFKKGQIDLAIEDFTESMRLEPRFVLPRMARAIAFLARNETGKALNDADEMVRSFPDSGIALETRAHILEAIGRRDDAIADYRKALAVEPDNPALTDEIEAVLRKFGVAP
jgi:tetratricopeptide (TPR) repeat protein